MVDNRYKHSDITEKIIGCALNIHKQLGNGFSEVVYHRCLEIEFKKNKINYNSEFNSPIFYDNIEVGRRRPILLLMIKFFWK